MVAGIQLFWFQPLFWFHYPEMFLLNWVQGTMGSKWGRNKRKGGLVEAPRPWTLCSQQYSSLAGKTTSWDNSFRKNCAGGDFLSHYYFIPKLPNLCAQTSARCVTCVQNNASQGPRPNPGVQTVETLPLKIQKWTLLKSSPTGAISIYLW